MFHELNALAKYNDWTVVHITDDEWAANVSDHAQVIVTSLNDTLVQVDVTYDGDLIAALEVDKHDAVATASDLVKHNL
ncbi:TPA: hypothetical protein NJ351_003354 [Vibrio parahaemolyticus]|nr:hypothetical protein [Vibrio parahaemolyticus]